MRHQHFDALDGLRGLAALAVMFSHLAYAYTDTVSPDGLAGTILMAVRNTGHAAVVLFFALSGFVLFVAFERRPDTPYVSYLIRRLFRIWPALLAALIIAAILHALIPLTPAGPWTQSNWRYDFSPTMFVRHVLLLGVSEHDRILDPVSWSLAVEVRFSLLLYPLALLLRANRGVFLALALACYGIGRLTLSKLEIHEPYQVGHSILGTLAMTLFYLPGFCLGMLTAAIVLRGQRPIPAWLQIGGFILGAAVGRFAHDDLIGALGDILAIYVLTTPGPVTSILTHHLTAWLGRVSYSLYIIHLPLVFAATFALTPVVG
jgi:peptidoglycan/LPS O-acetylase OafA/YrhL